MKRLTMTTLGSVVLAFVVSTVAEEGAAAEVAKTPPEDRVVAIYFHRTQRCPTCQKMGSYTEAAIKTGFATQLLDRSVEFHYVDFQNEKNAAYTKAYKITGPALIVARIKDNRVAEYKDLKEIWSNVGDQKAFMKYVQHEIEAARGKGTAN